MWEIVLILLVALIVLGPRQLTEVAQTLGKLYRDLQRMSFDVRSAIDMDSPTPPPPSTSSKPPAGDTHPTIAPQEDFLPHSGDKSGPDFYADLLEDSRQEKAEEETAKSESPRESENGPEALTRKVGDEKPSVRES